MDLDVLDTVSFQGRTLYILDLRKAARAVGMDPDRDDPRSVVYRVAQAASELAGRKVSTVAMTEELQEYLRTRGI